MSLNQARPAGVLLTFAVTMALAGCDAATTIAGDAMKGEARNMVTAQCEQVAGGAGIVSARVAEVCQCTAETLVAGGSITPAEITRARVETIVNDCAKRTSTADNAARTEDTGG